MDLSWLFCILLSEIELVMLYSTNWIWNGYDVFCRLDLSRLCCILQTGMELFRLDWGGYDIFCRLDLSQLCCILQTRFELVMMYSTDWI